MTVAQVDKSIDESSEAANSQNDEPLAAHRQLLGNEGPHQGAGAELLVRPKETIKEVHAPNQ
jgi:hypothetical protein